MAQQLDLEEQEQIDQLKAFWKQYGNLITAVATLVLLAFAGWNGWNWWQREQAAKAAVVFEQVDQALQGGSLDKAQTLFGEMKDRFGRATLTGHAGLLLARSQAEKGQIESAAGVLDWVAGHAADKGHRALAQLRLAGLAMDRADWVQAGKYLDAVDDPAFKALVNDRRGDLAMGQGQREAAVSAWQKAHADLAETLEYRRVVEAKLAAAGAAPAAASAPADGKEQK
ncbi:YfgM family protein [Ideonella livida]|uniref:Ancillary SecYEG translocon subunit n=1 Tax=Ideonella livida TaxID=2707176 RepID=A0A7C9TIW0_9BURK|nr:tetratricopeptide repeat protein [Ideonella livida]NDY90704.1 tetratricopeptide repeat protein [Ideonella livida]